MLLMPVRRLLQASPPSRGAWIEIAYEKLAAYIGKVAPLAGGVD